MQIQTPIVTMIAKGTWCINEYGMDAMFLLEGAHKALLIDTGTGTFDPAGPYTREQSILTMLRLYHTI